MAIGDTWETINTYAFTDGTTIITADFLNDAVNDLQFLYQRTDANANMWTVYNNTDTTISATTNDVALGTSVTFTPASKKVMLLITYHAPDWVTTPYVDIGVKVGSGSITYINKNNAETAALSLSFKMVFAEATVTSGASNTVTLYGKNTDASSRVVGFCHMLVIEKAN